MDNWRRQVLRESSEAPKFGIRITDNNSDSIYRSIYKLSGRRSDSSTRVCYKNLKRGTFFYCYERYIKDYLIPLAIKVQL